MMRLPTFRYCAPKTPEEVVSVLKDEGPAAAQVVAGGTDLFPNMKRRQHEPKTVVSLRHVDALRGLEWRADGSLRIGPAETLRAVERDPGVKERLPGLWQAVVSISTPILRNTGTIGGNVCLDTRCNYLNQNFEWRRAINHCLKCSGDTCWTAPGGTRCWAVNSSDTVPLMIVLGARFRLLGPDGAREIDAADMYASVDDGREWLTRRADELLTDIVIPPQGAAKSTYVKLRRRAAFDFPVLGVAARVEASGKVEWADLVLNALGPAPIRCLDAERALVGGPLTDATIAEAADLAPRAARPLDNTDHMPSWRKKMVRVHVRRALEALR
ncbi:MAG: FAD binding domain-containing protein [Planctomycetota bacterium]|jgi:4-hydroxybenzoyl-CoA reductase subunit beta